MRGLINEAQLAVKISHPNVLHYEFFHDGSLFKELPPYIIMELADEGSLSDFITKQKEQIPLEEIQKIYRQLIDGIKVINKHIVHRDLKPKNILIKNGILKIADFGLSKIVYEKTRTHSFKGWGTPKYMAPEAWRGQANTIQMDIYSMGIIFYELLTLKYPFTIKNEYDYTSWEEAHLYSVPNRIEQFRQDVHPKICQVILKMTEKETKVRYKSWEDIERDLGDSGHSNSLDHTVKKIIQKKMEKDEQEQKERLSAQKRQQERDQFIKMVKYKIEKDIINPLTDLINQINQSYVQGKISISSKSIPYNQLFEYQIHLLSGTMLILKIAPLHDEDCVKERIIDDYGEKIMRREMQRPTLNKRNILAWGMLESQYGTGFNIVLLESKDDIYGEWYVLINTNSALATKHRRGIEPFSFRFDELDREMQCVNAMHVYNTKVEILSIKHFAEYIEKYN